MDQLVCLKVLMRNKNFPQKFASVIRAFDNHLRYDANKGMYVRIHDNVFDT